MAQITLKITDASGAVSIAGESTITGHEDELEALAIRDLVFAPSTAGKAYLSEVFVTRFRDKATPKLAEACAMGENIKTVTISVFRNTDDGPKVMMQYELEETYVSRIEHETEEDGGGAFLPYVGYGQAGESAHRAALNRWGLTMNADRGYARRRAQPTPAFPMPVAASVSNAEVERLWLNPAKIKWTYTPGRNRAGRGREGLEPADEHRNLGNHCSTGGSTNVSHMC